MALNVLKPQYQTQEVLDAIKECLDSGWTGMGNKTEVFEKEFIKYTDLNHAHYVNSATSGLHLALNVFKNLYKWNDGDEVITTPLTFVSTNHAILYENLTPVFADVDNQLCLDPSSLASLITPKTKAVMFVGLGGNVGQYDQVRDICLKNNIKLIYDAAHSMGTKVDRIYDGVAVAKSQVGYDADAVVFSFQAVKNLPTADSGMVCFKDSQCDALSRQISWLGIDKDTFARTNRQGSYKWDYDVPNVGFKYNGNSIMAAIGLTQLKYVEQDNEYRRSLAQMYEDELSQIPQIKIIKHSNCVSARHLFQIRVEDREELLQYFYKNDVYPGVHYKSNKEYPMYKNCKGQTPRADKVQHELISLPLHLGVDKSDIMKVCSLIRTYYVK
jgi:dTDP-4-amino-4,6-dideoxygalactose transaminase